MPYKTTEYTTSEVREASRCSALTAAEYKQTEKILLKWIGLLLVALGI